MQAHVLPGPGARVYPVDVADSAAVAAAAQDFRRALRRAGPRDRQRRRLGRHARRRARPTSAKLRRVLEVNVTGLAATLAAFAPAMRASRPRHAAPASPAWRASAASPGAGAYSASKAAAITWLESLRAELHGSGVSVVCVCPGYIDTPMTRVNRYRMPFLLAGRRSRAAHRARHRGAPAPRGHSVADGRCSRCCCARCRAGSTTGSRRARASRASLTATSRFQT